MNTEKKNELLEEFQKYLEQNKLDSFATDEQPDLNTLLTELTGLKTEVKTESRQFKNTLDTLNSTLSTVQDDNKALSTELAAYSERLQHQQEELTRTMLLDIVDIYARMSTGLTVLHNYRPLSAVLRKSRKKDVSFITRFKEGQVMTHTRFEQFLQQHQVQEIECVGKLLDPVTMTAVETGQDPRFENGIVLQELRKGFLFQDQVLRLAEVKVNKIDGRYTNI